MSLASCLVSTSNLNYEQLIWNLFREIGEEQERIEILDWYHLIENLYKVGGSFHRIEEVKCFLWKGEVDDAISCFEGWSEPQVENFITYLNKHKHRIVNYGYFQEIRHLIEACPIVQSYNLITDSRSLYVGFAAKSLLVGSGVRSQEIGVRR